MHIVHCWKPGHKSQVHCWEPRHERKWPPSLFVCTVISCYVMPYHKSLESPESAKTAADEISPESIFFADCGPMKPLNFVEELSFTTKCDINKEKDCLEETQNAEHLIETKSADDHDSNRENLLGQPESASSQYGGREESSIWLLHDTRTKTDEGPAGSFKKGQKGSRSQIMEENKDKHTSQCSVAKDGKNGSTELHKRKQDEETCDVGAKKPRKLHCQCLQPSSGKEIRCMLCSERYCDWR